MKLSYIIQAAVVSFVTAIGTAGYIASSHTTDATLLAPVKETVSSRVMRTKTLRCSYVIYEPYFMVDPNTKTKSGIFYETTELIGKKLGLHIDWVGETTFANLETDMRSGKADMFCAGLWEDTQKADIVQYSDPLSYAPVFAYIRVSPETDGITTLAEIGEKKLKIAYIDGEMSQLIQQRLFSDNPTLSAPNISDISLNAENIATGKADVTFIEPAVANAYLAKNPGKLRLLNKQPIQVFGNTFAVMRGEGELINYINIAIHSALNSGEIEAITKKYTHAPEEILMPTLPYQMP